MLLKGFRLGMLLQLSVGPVCIMVMNVSAAGGFWFGMVPVLAIALIDALYIALSCMGVAALIRKTRVRRIVQAVGCLVLVLFGANTLLDGGLQVALLPDLAWFNGGSGQSLFIQGLLLTASNPLTIVFWGGIFSAQVMERELDNVQLFFFALGCVLATVVFLTAVAFLGSMVRDFLPQLVIRILHMAVGGLLIFFGIRLLLKKESGPDVAPIYSHDAAGRASD